MDTDPDPDSGPFSRIPMYLPAGGRTRKSSGGRSGINITTVVRLNPEREGELVLFDFRAITETLRAHGQLSVAEIGVRVALPIVSVNQLLMELSWQNRIILNVPELEPEHDPAFLEKVLNGIRRL